jgi:hypothetical protein
VGGDDDVGSDLTVQVEALAGLVQWLLRKWGAMAEAEVAAAALDKLMGEEGQRLGTHMRGGASFRLESGRLSRRSMGTDSDMMPAAHLTSTEGGSDEPLAAAEVSSLLEARKTDVQQLVRAAADPFFKYAYRYVQAPRHTGMAYTCSVAILIHPSAVRGTLFSTCPHRGSVPYACVVGSGGS